MTKIAVLCVPFIRYEFHSIFAMQTILSIKQQVTNHDVDLIAVVNSIRKESLDIEMIESNFDYSELNDSNNLARAWNRGILQAEARGAEYVLILNMDLILHPQFIDNIIAYAKSRPDNIIWSGATWDDQGTLLNAPLEGEALQVTHFSCFMVRSDFISTIGGFDEQFGPAYHEDVDMIYRLRLGKHLHSTTNTARFYHLDRVSIKGAMIEKDNEFLDFLRVKMDESMEAYEKKWGGSPGNEKFTVPYDRK